MQMRYQNAIDRRQKRERARLVYPFSQARTRVHQKPVLVGFHENTRAIAFQRGARRTRTEKRQTDVRRRLRAHWKRDPSKGRERGRGAERFHDARCQVVLGGVNGFIETLDSSTSPEAASSQVMPCETCCRAKRCSQMRTVAAGWFRV